jgi:hypothetical protein
MQQALGELVTCTRCVGTWAAAARVDADLAPRFGRLLTWSLGRGRATTSSRPGFTALTEKANELS